MGGFYRFCRRAVPALVSPVTRLFSWLAGKIKADAVEAAVHVYGPPLFLLSFVLILAIHVPGPHPPRGGPHSRVPSPAARVTAKLERVRRDLKEIELLISEMKKDTGCRCQIESSESGD